MSVSDVAKQYSKWEQEKTSSIWTAANSLDFMQL